jgi:hypothetical protein
LKARKRDDLPVRGVACPKNIDCGSHARMIANAVLIADIDMRRLARPPQPSAPSTCDFMYNRPPSTTALPS